MQMKKEPKQLTDKQKVFEEANRLGLYGFIINVAAKTGYL